MKKLKKISLKLNKEIVSHLSNNNLNQLKGGTKPLTGHDSCLCPESVMICIVSKEQSACLDTCKCVGVSDAQASLCVCAITYNC